MQSISGSSVRYVVISPVKDEAGYIEKTIHSMAAQRVLPAQWVIVNDGSRDDTEEIVRAYMENYPWIKLVSRPPQVGRKRGKGVVEAFYAGYDVADKDFDFIVKLDGDVSFDPDYFPCLLDEFAADPKLGIAGGGLHEKTDGKNWNLTTKEYHVRGATKIYRRACFEEIGGLSPSMGWDGIDEWKAMANGWKVKSFLQYRLLHYRITGAATGLVKGNYEVGTGAYRMGYHPLFTVARGIWRMKDRPYVIGGLTLMWGYFRAWLRREPLLAEPKVVRFIRQTQMKNLAALARGKKIDLT